MSKALSMVDVLEELPIALERYYYPGASTTGGRDGLLLRLRPPDRPPWIGVFEFGSREDSLVTEVFSHPDPQKLFVIARGRGYIIEPASPTQWEDLAPYPIAAAWGIEMHDLTVFSDFTRLTAYGAAGIAWTTPRLGWDELVVTDITADTIIGAGSDPTLPQPVEFRVDIRTGVARGGSNPDKYTPIAIG
jgi:hypothetical protein